MLLLLYKKQLVNIRVLQEMLVIACLAAIVVHCKNHRKNIHKYYNSDRLWFTRSTTVRTCIEIDDTLRARRRTCFLRPDSGPCRADILQWYFDVKQRRCYRFFWGGCQGNGNRFETKEECLDHCFLDFNAPKLEIPHFCSLAFDFGSCFGHYNRWTYDKIAKTCKRRLYSGCGGNQNNFETQAECIATCMLPPNNTLVRAQHFTTCVPINIPQLQ